MEMASRDNRYLTFQGGSDTHCHNLLFMVNTTTTLADQSRYEDGPGKFVRKQKMVEEVLAAWWDKWYSQVLSSLRCLSVARERRLTTSSNHPGLCLS